MLNNVMAWFTQGKESNDKKDENKKTANLTWREGDFLRLPCVISPEEMRIGKGMQFEVRDNVLDCQAGKRHIASWWATGSCRAGQIDGTAELSTAHKRFSFKMARGLVTISREGVKPISFDLENGIVVSSDNAIALFVRLTRPFPAVTVSGRRVAQISNNIRVANEFGPCESFFVAADPLSETEEMICWGMYLFVSLHELFVK